MLKIDKVAEPAFFTDFKRINNPQNWDEISPVRSELRSHIIDNEQKVAGVALCTYCERKVTLESSHIDHIRPKDARGRYAHLFADYNNLTVSCLSANSCGHAKDNNYDDNFINPVEENPSEFMTYEISTAKIVPVNDNVKQWVERTSEMLKLNSCYEILNARRRILLSLNAQKQNNVIEYYIDSFKEFPTLIEFYRREFLS